MEELLAALLGLGAILFLLIIAFWILVIVAQWKLFVKAGEEGWKSIIPIYNTVVLFKIIGLNPWLVLLYLLSGIPIVGTIVLIALGIIVAIKTAKAFGQESAFAIGLFLLPQIFQMILGFGSAEYVGPAEN